MDMTPKAQATKPKRNEWDCMHRKAGAKPRTPSTEQRGSTHRGRKYLQTTHLTRRSCPK